MVYRARAVAFGMYDRNPLVGFVLASKSASNRELVVNPPKNKVEVWALGEGIEKIRQNIRYPRSSIENLYACITGFEDTLGRPILTSSNGLMGERLRRNLENPVENPSLSVRSIMEGAFRYSFVPKYENDPRITAVLIGGGSPCAYYGAYLKSGKGYKGPFVDSLLIEDDNRVGYLTLNSCMKLDPKAFIESTSKTGIEDRKHKISLSASDVLESIILEKEQDLNGLARQLFFKILGKEPEGGIGAAVGMFKGGKFEFGAYNDSHGQLMLPLPFEPH
ncbi:MAG: hypothetical protein U9O94_07805 [Nanoarchaeota archaeon]|nr:hypothetical protein [Nanoarchaeota archaeon]